MNSHQIRFDEDLVRRYDRSGPRYTSYPTAVQFSDRFGVNEYRAVARGQQPGPDPAAAVAVRAHPVLLEPVLLLRLHQGHHAQPREGRGLPVPAAPRDRDAGRAVRPRPRRRAAALRRRHADVPDLARDRAAGREDGPALPGCRRTKAANTRSSSTRARSRPTRCATCIASASIAAASASRTSIPAVQEAVNRVQSVPDTLRLIREAREFGFNSVSVDLIYGLPKQSVAGFLADARHGARRRGRTASPSTRTRTCRRCSSRRSRSRSRTWRRPRRACSCSS